MQRDDLVEYTNGISVSIKCMNFFQAIQPVKQPLIQAAGSRQSFSHSEIQSDIQPVRHLSIYLFSQPVNQPLGPTFLKYKTTHLNNPESHITLKKYL
jgi:hypothetical protein